MFAMKVENLGVKFRIAHRNEKSWQKMFIKAFNRKSAQGFLENKEKNDTFWALKEVSFIVNEGDSFGVVGPNGAGKSTLLQILTGIYKPDEGTMERIGRVGLLQLGTGFHPELSARDNIFLNGAILGLKKSEVEDVFDEIVSFSELEKFIDQPVKTFSSGMTARLGFSIAINIDPDILLIDEILAVGDEHFKEKSRRKLDEKIADGKTIVLVTHNLNEIKNTCNRGICLFEGRLAFEGTGVEIVDFYKTEVKKRNNGQDKISYHFKA